MKNTDSVPRQNSDETTENLDAQSTQDASQQEQSVEVKKKSKERVTKKKKKRSLWPLKAMLITLVLAAAVNAASTLVLEDSSWWLATILTVVILLLGVIFDIIGTASTACDIQPFLAMASRKVKGAKLAVKLCQKSDVVSSVCCDIVGDVCGIVSGISAATLVFLATSTVGEKTTVGFVVSVAIYAVISTLTITLKAVGKRLAISKANAIIFGVAKTLSIFRKEG